MRTFTLYITLSLALVFSACNSSKFGGGKKKKSSTAESSDQEVAQVVCLKESADCAVLSCTDVLKLHDQGLVNDSNREVVEEAIASCHHRGSSDDQEPVHDERNDSEDSDENESEDEDEEKSEHDHASHDESDDCPEDAY